MDVENEREKAVRNYVRPLFKYKFNPPSYFSRDNKWYFAIPKGDGSYTSAVPDELKPIAYMGFTTTDFVHPEQVYEKLGLDENGYGSESQIRSLQNRFKKLGYNAEFNSYNNGIPLFELETVLPSRQEAEKKAVIKVGDLEKVGTFAKGGKLDDPPKGGFIINNYRAKNSKTYKERAAASEKAMFVAWRGRDSRRDYNATIEEGGPMQNSFLLSGQDKDRYMLEHGYLLGERGDYGLVNKAVGGNNYQVYQTQADEADRNNLIPIGNIDNTWFGRENAELQHAGAYPSTIYIDGRNPENFYQKAWDLNNYDNPLDWFGYPAVQTTGFSKIENPKSKKASITVDNETRKRHITKKSPMDFFNKYLNEHNLTREVLDDGTIVYALPTVHVKPSTFAKGGKLIKK